MAMSKQWWKKLSIRSIEQGAESLAAGLRAFQQGGAAGPTASPVIVQAGDSGDSGSKTWTYVAIGGAVLLLILLASRASR
jgi:hypothetical protein